MEVAPQHSEAVGEGSRIGMEKRLLLDRIALHPANVSPRNIQRSAAIVANLANSWLTVRNRAAVAASVATHTIAVELFVKLALTHVFVNDVTQSRHDEYASLDILNLLSWKYSAESTERTGARCW
jgi:hypothetical protein